MKRLKFIVIFAIAVILLYQISPVFAQGHAVELTDEELDTVFAAGFNFADFESFIGSLTNVINDESTGSMLFGVLDTPNGQVGLIVQAEESAFALPASSSGGAAVPATLNSVSVADTAQQYLQSWVNVNAAGSVVPVQINVTVLMDSIVENLTNQNSLQINFQSPLNP